MYKMSFTAHNSYPANSFTDVIHLDTPSEDDYLNVLSFCRIYNEYWRIKGAVVSDEDELNPITFAHLDGKVGEDTISLTDGECHYMLRQFIPADIVVKNNADGTVIWT